jgi:hypothetical protein
MVGGVQPSVPTKQPVALGFNIGSGMASVAWLSRVTGASNSELQPAPKPPTLFLASTLPSRECACPASKNLENEKDENEGDFISGAGKATESV